MYIYIYIIVHLFCILSVQHITVIMLYLSYSPFFVYNLFIRDAARQRGAAGRRRLGADGRWDEGAQGVSRGWTVLKAA